MEPTYTIPKYAGNDEVVTLVEAKAQLRLDHDYEDTEIQGFIDAAIKIAESYIGGIILSRDVEFGLEDWVERFDFPVGPASAVLTVKYQKSGNVTYTTAAETDFKLYAFGNNKHQLILKEAIRSFSLVTETLDAVKINATIGWLKADIPEDIIHAVKLILTDLYEFRGEKEVKLNTSSKNLLRPYKHWA